MTFEKPMLWLFISKCVVSASWNGFSVYSLWQETLENDEPLSAIVSSLMKSLGRIDTLEGKATRTNRFLPALSIGICLLWKKRICSLGSKCFYSRADPTLWAKGSCTGSRRKNTKLASPVKRLKICRVYPCPLSVNFSGVGWRILLCMDNESIIQRAWAVSFVGQFIRWVRRLKAKQRLPATGSLPLHPFAIE